MAKAYCIKEKKDLSYHGKFIPLAYDETTFSYYNLKWYNPITLKLEPDNKNQSWRNKDVSGWLPSTVGLYGFGEGRSRKGHFWIGGWTSSKENGDGDISEPLAAHTEDNIKMNFTTNPNVITKEQTCNWNNTTMLCYYYYSYKWDEDQNTENQYVSGADDHFIQNTSFVEVPENKTEWSETASHKNLYADPGSHIYRYNILTPDNPDNTNGLTRWRAGNSRL